MAKKLKNQKRREAKKERTLARRRARQGKRFLQELYLRG